MMQDCVVAMSDEAGVCSDGWEQVSMTTGPSAARPNLLDIGMSIPSPTYIAIDLGPILVFSGVHRSFIAPTSYSLFDNLIILIHMSHVTCIAQICLIPHKAMLQSCSDVAMYPQL